MFRHVPLRTRSWRIPRTHKTEAVLKALLDSRRLRKQCAECDVILAFGIQDLLVSLAFKACLGLPLLFALRGAPLLSREREPGKEGVWGTLYAAAYRVVVSFATSFADWIVVQTELDAQNAAQRYGVATHKLSVIPNNVIKQNERVLNDDEKGGSTPKRLLFLGTLSKRKGILRLLEAFAQIACRDDEVTLDVAGNGPLREEAGRFVTRHGLNERIRLHGYVKDPMPLLAGSDLLVVPSLFDAFPNVVLEAFGTDMPVIGADTGGITEMLQDELLLFRLGDTQALVRKLLLMQESTHYQKAKEVCRRRKKEYIFDWTGAFEDVLYALRDGSRPLAHSAFGSASRNSGEGEEGRKQRLIVDSW